MITFVNETSGLSKYSTELRNRGLTESSIFFASYNHYSVVVLCHIKCCAVLLVRVSFSSPFTELFPPNPQPPPTNPTTTSNDLSEYL